MEKLEKVVDKIALDPSFKGLGRSILVGLEVLKHTEAINNLVTNDEFTEKMNKVLDGQDKIMVILTRLDQERVFTIERIRRVEEELNKIKVHLALS